MMESSSTTTAYSIGGVRVLECSAEGPVLRSSQDAVDLIVEAMQQSASLVVLPGARVDPRFFELRSQMAGEIVQKFVNYSMRLAVVGDFSTLISESTSLRAFILESNRGSSIWFLGSIEELKKRLAEEERRMEIE